MKQLFIETLVFAIFVAATVGVLMYTAGHQRSHIPVIELGEGGNA